MKKQEEITTGEQVGAVWKVISAFITIGLAIWLLSSCTTVNAQSVTRKVDDFSEKVTIYTYYKNSVGLYKIVENDKVTNYLTLKCIGYSCVVDGTGAYVIFEDGTKWQNISVDIDCDASIEGSGYGYSALCRLSEKDLQLFATKKVKKFKLYIFEDKNTITNFEKCKNDFAEAVGMK